MVPIDAEQLKQESPSERIKAITALRAKIAERLASWQEQTETDLQTLATLEQDAQRELATITRIEVPKTREIKVEEIGKKKTLEETVAPAKTTTDHANLLQHAYDFAHKHAYDKIADIRDKFATGETLTPAEERTAQYFGELLQSFHKVSSYIRDEQTKETLTRSEKAIQQMQNKHDTDAEEPTKRQEF
ncbi:MAG: hypothetical protein AABY01_04805 [Nanoarchaeota archaeon]